jgi:hypothetical protein
MEESLLEHVFHLEQSFKQWTLSIEFLSATSIPIILALLFRFYR